MGEATLVNICMIRNMVLESLYGQMDGFMKASGRMVNNTAKADILKNREKLAITCGRMELKEH